MARTFDGSDDRINLGAGALSDFTFGTLLLVMQRNSTGWNGPLVLHNSSGTSLAGLEIGPAAGVDNRLFYLQNSNSKKSGFTITNADGWILTGAGKATGTATPRFHKYVYGTNTWTHSDAVDGTLGNNTGTTNIIRLGVWELSDYFSGDIAVAAVWKRLLTDAEVEALAHSLQAWYASAPDAMWVLDQQATTQTVGDVTGGGANESSKTGTAVATSSPVGPGYGHAVLIPHSVPAGGGGTDATVNAATIAAAASVPAATPQTGSTVSPAAVAAVAALPAASVQAGQTVTPAVISAVASVPAPTVQTGSTVTPAAVAAVATMPAATPQGGAQINPAAIAAVAAVPAPSVRTGSTVSPAAIAGVATTPSAGASAGATVTPAVIVVGSASSGRPTSRTSNGAGLKIDVGDLVPPTLPITGMTGSGTTRTIVAAGVYEGYDFPGAVTVSADGVTIRNCRWDGSGDFWCVQSYDHDTIIEDCEFSTPVDRCITGSGFTARRLLFHDCGGDAFQLGDGGNALPTLIEDCTAYDWRPEMDNHVDGVHLFENGVHDLTIRRCWFELVDAPGYTNPGGDTGYTSPVFCQPTTPGSGSQGTIRVESNYLESSTGFFAIRFEDGVGSRCIAVNNVLAAVPNGGEQIDAAAPFEGALNVLADGVTEYHHPQEIEPLDPLPGGGQIPTPEVRTGSTASPAAIAAVAALPAASVQTGQTVTPAAIAGVATMPAPSVSAGSNATVTPAAIACVADVPAPDLATGSTVTPAAVAAVASVPATGVQAGSTVAPAAIAASTDVPSPAPQTGSTVTPSPVAASAVVPAPSVQAGGAATVSPSVIAAVAVIPDPVVATSVTITPAVIGCAAALPAPTVTTGSTVTPTEVAATTTIPAPTVGSAVTITPAVIACTATIPAPVVGGGTTVTPAGIACVAAMPAVTLTAGTSVLPGVIVAAVAIPTPAVNSSGEPIPALSGTASANTRALSGTATTAGLAGTAQIT